MFGAEPNVVIRCIAHGEIPPYLALADLGLLLRYPSPVNRVASPVKFAEYLACGVPVLVSRGVGDCAEVVRKERVGYVLDDAFAPARAAAEIRANRAALRARCRATAQRYFDWERHAPSYAALIFGHCP
jgi:glycosyltransferase involved in cell wall biosynthesis